MAAQNVKDVFDRHMPEKLRAKPDVVAKINAVYQFNISGPAAASGRSIAPSREDSSPRGPPQTPAARSSRRMTTFSTS